MKMNKLAEVDHIQCVYSPGPADVKELKLSLFVLSGAETR